MLKSSLGLEGDNGRMAAILPEFDPIVAKVESIQARRARYNEILMAEPRTSDGTIAFGTPEYEAWEDIEQSECAQFVDALKALIVMQPTSMAGAVALISCYLAIEGSHLDRGNVLLLRNLQDFLSQQEPAAGPEEERSS